MKKKAPLLILPILVGSMTLSRTLDRPRMAEIHTVDVVSLLAAGACFGAAMVGLIRLFVKR